ncbi:Ig-like domain-containing protein [Duganella sp. PWIR1]
MTAPVLKTVSVSSNTTIVLHFDRAVVAGDANIVISDGYGQTYSGSNGLSTRIVGATDKHVIAADDSHVSYNGMDVTITLTSPLKSGLSYSVTMESDAVTDSNNESAGNDAISSPKFFNFVASGSAPTIATPSAVVGATLHFTDTGTNASDYITATLDQTITGTYTGTLGTNDFVQVSLDNGASWHKASVNTGSKTWSYSEHVDEDNLLEGEGGTYGVLLARVSNNAGGSSASASHEYTYSNQPIEIFISGEGIRFSADTGSSDFDLITKTAAQTVRGGYSGFLASGQTVQVSVNGGTTWVDATASDGLWHTTGTVTLLSGSHSVMARVVDAAGNTSPTASASYLLDTTVPVSLSGRALTLQEGSDNGVSSTDGVTSSASGMTLNVAGLHGVHAGDTIQIVDTSNNSAVVGSYVIQAADLYYGDDYFSNHPFLSQPTDLKNISLDSLTQGTHVLAARVVDVAGNFGVASATTTVKYDSLAPTVSSSSPAADATAVDADSLTTLTFTFNENILIEDGSYIYITDDHNPDNVQMLQLSSSAVSGKVLTITLEDALTHGTEYTVSGLNVFDLAGNDAFTGDDDMLYFTTDGTYDGGGSWSGGGGGDVPATPSLSIVDTTPATDSSLDSDHVTKDNQVRIEGLDQTGTWEYRLNGSGDWLPGDTALTLPDGVYQAGHIEVRQTVNGVTSDVGTISHDVTVDTEAFNDDTLAGGGFTENSTSITGSLSADAALSDQIVEVTLDHGASWQAATLTPTSATNATFSLSADMSAEEAYGLRLSDSAGNVTKTIYYLSSRDSSYIHPEYDDIIVVDTGGLDSITLGDRAVVSGGGGYGDIITTGDDAVIIVGNDSYITTGNGSNIVTTGFGATVHTGSGDDVISCTNIEGGHIQAGGGDDLLTVTQSGTPMLMSSLDITGVEKLLFAGSGSNAMSITTGAVVQGFAGGNQLTIISSGSGTSITLDNNVWGTGVSQGSYMAYHDGLGSGSVVLLIGTNITVNLVDLTA